MTYGGRKRPIQQLSHPTRLHSTFSSASSTSATPRVSFLGREYDEEPLEEVPDDEEVRQSPRSKERPGRVA